MDGAHLGAELIDHAVAAANGRHVAMLAEMLDLQLEPARVAHVVGIHARHQSEPCLVEPSVERPDEAHVLLVDDPDPGIVERVEFGGRAVGGPVVDNQQLEMAVSLLEDARNRAREVAAAVVHRQEDRHRGGNVLADRHHGHDTGRSSGPWQASDSTCWSSPTASTVGWEPRRSSMPGGSPTGVGGRSCLGRGGASPSPRPRPSLPLPAAFDLRAIRARGPEAARAAAGAPSPPVVHAHGTRSQLLCPARRPAAVRHHARGRPGRRPGRLRDRRAAAGPPRRGPARGPGLQRRPCRWPLADAAARQPAAGGPGRTGDLPAAGPPAFVWVGRLDAPKRPDVFVRACADAATRHGSSWAWWSATALCAPRPRSSS